MKTLSERRCLYCGNTFTGRSDKTFCNVYCKSAYHNNKSNSDESYIREVNKQLRKNRSALKKACPEGKATVRISFLRQMGMDFYYFTHIWKSQNGNQYYFSYDYGFMYIQDPEKVLIIQRQDYMK